MPDHLHSDGFQVAEYLLVCLHARGAKSIRTAQRKMAGADVARWNAARSATFAKIIARLELSLS